MPVLLDRDREGNPTRSAWRDTPCRGSFLPFIQTSTSEDHNVFVENHLHTVHPATLRSHGFSEFVAPPKDSTLGFLEHCKHTYSSYELLRNTGPSVNRSSTMNVEGVLAQQVGW